MPEIQVTIEGIAKTLPKSQYVSLKHKGLVQFGYDTLTEEEVANQLEAVLEGKEFGKGLNIIGMFIQRDHPVAIDN